jgi:phosphatidylserine/phosphatidylglycerophosphate/cardiolipin synthase-like enzyme
MASKQPAPGRKVAITDGADADGVASPSVSTNNDIVRNRLDKIDASAPCTIAVAEGLISNRPAVFDKLASLANKGCKVRVLGNDGSRENADGQTIFNSRRDALRTMKNGGARIKLGRVHDKLILIDAKVDGERKRLVFTGSHNLTASANNINDELFIGLRGASIYDAYVAHFDRVFAKSDAF